jgi:hypothetical protein
MELRRIIVPAAAAATGLALFGGAGMAFGAGSAPDETLSAQIYLNGDLGSTTVNPGDDLNVGTNLNGTQGDSNGGSFTVNFDPAFLKYTGGTSISGTDGPCSMPDAHHVKCPMDIHNTSKGITFPFTVKDSAEAGKTQVRFKGVNGYGDKAIAKGTITVEVPSNGCGCGSTTPPSSTPPSSTPPSSTPPSSTPPSNGGGTTSTPPSTTPPAAGSGNGGGTSGHGGNSTTGGNGQVTKTPKGSVNTGGGATAGVEQPWLFGIGGAAVLAGAGAAAAAGTRLRKQ